VILEIFYISSLSLANRSAVLFKLKEYRRSVEDIDLALEAGYPVNLRYKVAERRYRCSLMLNDHKQFVQDLQLVGCLLLGIIA
jgi:hypothetical protein